MSINETIIPIFPNEDWDYYLVFEPIYDVYPVKFGSKYKIVIYGESTLGYPVLEIKLTHERVITIFVDRNHEYKVFRDGTPMEVDFSILPESIFS